MSKNKVSIDEMNYRQLFKLAREFSKKSKNGSYDPTLSENVIISERVDSRPYVFGINEENKMFVESEKWDQDHLDAIKENVTNNKLLKVVLKNIKKEIGSPVKFEAEIFPCFNHEFDEENYGVFNAIPYNKACLGESGSIVVVEALVWNGRTWEELPDNIRPGIRSLYKEIKEADCKQWRVYTVEDLKIETPINHQYNFSELDDYLNDDDKFQHGLKILESNWLTPEHRRLRESLKSFRANILSCLESVSNTHQSYLNGKMIEGVSIRYVDENEIFTSKYQTPLYKEEKQSKWRVRKATDNIIKSAYNKIKKEVLQLQFVNSKTINEVIKKHTKKFEEDMSDDVYIETIGSMLETLIRPEASFDNLKEKTSHIIKEAKLSLLELEKDIHESQYDTNTSKKTYRRIEKAEEVLNHLNRSLLETNLDGYEFLIHSFLEVFKNSLNVPFREKEDVITEVITETEHKLIDSKIKSYLWKR